ncbi:hypothetical protein EKN56_12775 [Limnobaculum zhutongyuii]|uniref:Uncharacterized protein n=1 Tax=Limnobaculum zhutongyuii TaxID=2498113 RepID=A0A411WM10_9GAMM|nr:hypothetical protein [Limnobaculum zhutongyuii]QBH97190.1 hypothetical protein EKN56_12775 [Limnobaculum zhutongyuii]TQS88449.1 hypothetical protein ELQ32_10560 [Limnobaculum zhutongyuii]
MKIKSAMLRAALVCVAKNDARYYLNGIHITPKYIEATNGHVALRLEHGINTRRNIIVQFIGHIPVRADMTELTFGKSLLATHYDAHGQRIGFTAIKLLDGRFPDLDRVVPTMVDHNINPVVQAGLLSYPEKMFGRERKFIPMQLLPSGKESAVLIKFDTTVNSMYGNPKFVVMPCRDSAFEVVKEFLG